MHLKIRFRQPIKKHLILITALLLSISLIIIFFIFTAGRNGKQITIYDYRKMYSYEFKVTSKSDLKVINEVKANMSTVNNDTISTELKFGGFVLLREYIGDTIITYRVQGPDVTKTTAKGSLDNIIETLYYHLDSKYYRKLYELCEKYTILATQK